MTVSTYDWKILVKGVQEIWRLQWKPKEIRNFEGKELIKRHGAGDRVKYRHGKRKGEKFWDGREIWETPIKKGFGEGEEPQDEKLKGKRERKRVHVCHMSTSCSS
jgi:hypothetical protein